MFKKLREKISGWSKKFSEEAEEEITEETKTEEQETSKEETKEKQEEISEDLEKKPKETSEKETTEDKQKEQEKKSSKKEETAEIETPKKFNIGTQQFEPDTEKIKEISEDLEKEEKISEKKSEKTETSETEKETSEKKGFFSKFASGGKIKISEENFDNYAEELELILLENNVALETTEKIIEELKEKITKEEIPKKEIESKIREALKETIKDSLSEPFDIEEKIKEKSASEAKKEPYVLLFCGINGTGKTTTIAKIANRLKQKNISSLIAAGDTFRAASVEQLKKHGETLGINVISSSYGADPASVGFDAINNAKKNNIDCVLIDTAGRMHTDKNLIKQIEKISRVCQPDLKVFVGESITGNDSIEQIRAFNEAIGIDSIILTKTDIDEKGGTALSLGHIIKKPILYIGTGQRYEDIEKFDKDKFIEKLGL